MKIKIFSVIYVRRSVNLKNKKKIKNLKEKQVKMSEPKHFPHTFDYCVAILQNVGSSNNNVVKIIIQAILCIELVGFSIKWKLII